MGDVLVDDGRADPLDAPGERLVAAAENAGHVVEVVRGPSAVIAALVASGLPAGRFCFEGFLPRKGSGRRERLVALASESRTMVFYEAPHRVVRTLADLAEALGSTRRVTIARELNKLHEELWRGSLEGAQAWAEEHPPRGEFVLVVAGAPVCVLAESPVEVPFIEESTPMLGVVAATDKTYLLETLARWILDRTDKETAFAANFAFMRIAAANRIITSCALTNMATGALVFLPGADYPVMALAQVGMLFELAAVFGRGIKPERGYEVAGVLAGGLVIRAVTRALVKQTPHIGFAVKALTAAAGTYGMGRALVSLYERDVDYSRANEVVTATFSRVRDLVTTVAGATRPMASYQDASDLAA